MTAGRTTTRRTVAAIAVGALLPGTGHLMIGARNAGTTLLAVSAAVLLTVAAALGRFAVAPLDGVAFAAAPGSLALLGTAAAAWLLYTAGGTTDLLRRCGGPAPAALAFLLVPAVVCSLLTASAFTGSGILTSIFRGDGSLDAHDGRYTVLLVGADRAPGRSAVMPDSISVVSVDATTGRTAVIGIDRTTQNFDFPAGSALAAAFPAGNRCTTGCALNHAYPFGLAHAELWPDAADPGMAALGEAVEGYTGLRLSGYVYVELDAFVRLIDAVGGVTVEVGTAVRRIGVPDEGADELTVVGPPIEPGLQHMDGETALWFARSRFGSSNAERMLRQGCLEDALLTQLDPTDVLAAVFSLASTTDGIRTDISADGLGTLASLAEKARTHPLARVDLGHPLVEPLQPDLAIVAEAVAAVLDGAALDDPPTPENGTSAGTESSAGNSTAAADPTAEPTGLICAVPAASTD